MANYSSVTRVQQIKKLDQGNQIPSLRNLELGNRINCLLLRLLLQVGSVDQQHLRQLGNY